MRGVIKYKPGLSDDYKDLVNSILKYEVGERIPLIKVFDHPWVKNFEQKYNLSKTPAAPKQDEREKKLALQRQLEAKSLAIQAQKDKLAEQEA